MNILRQQKRPANHFNTKDSESLLLFWTDFVYIEIIYIYFKINLK